MIGEWVKRKPYLRTELNAHRKETVILGDPADVWALAFAPEQSDEPRDAGGNRTVTPATLYLPAHQGTDRRDQWVIRGLTYKADGEAADWRSPFTGIRPGKVVTLERITG